MPFWSTFMIYLNFALRNALARTYVTRSSKGCCLLRERDFSIDTAISKCRAQEAARKQWADIASGLDSAQIRGWEEAD